MKPNRRSTRRIEPDRARRRRIERELRAGWPVDELEDRPGVNLGWFVLWVAAGTAFWIGLGFAVLRLVGR